MESEGNVDISSKAQFPKLQTFYKGAASKIKEDGRAETKHYPPIDPESLKEIYTLGGKLVRVFEARESGSQEELTEAAESLPAKFRRSYHILLRLILQLHDCIDLISCYVLPNEYKTDLCCFVDLARGKEFSRV